MKDLVKIENIQNLIFTFRNLQVMIDRDLAELYGVETKVLNQAVKRNINRFPQSFRFQLNDAEKKELVTNCDRFIKLKHSSVNPYAFTEQGVAMLSAVLHSDIAVEISIKIMEAFSRMRKFIVENANIFQRLEAMEKRQMLYQNETDQRFEQLFKALENKTLKPRQGIFFNGQIFDAHKFTSDIIRSANKSIILIDNYVDDTVLTLFSKKRQYVSVTIYTRTISKQLLLDARKFNSQYKFLTIKEFKKAHDRFLIIDEKDIYHFGASFKDLGKKWFAFSKFDFNVLEILNKLK